MGTPGTIIDRLGRGFIEQHNGHLVLHTAGSPYERGVQHGWLLRNQIRSCFQEAYLNGFFRCSTLFPARLWYAYSRLNSRFLNHDEIAELEGIAHGCGLKYRDILVMNSAHPLEAIYNLVKSGSISGCTQVILHHKATGSGGMLIGRNLDIINLAVLHKYTVLQVHKPNNGYAFVTPGFAGKVLDAITGWNEKGLHVSQDIAELPWENSYGLYSGALLRRLSTSCATINDAIQLITQLPLLGGGGKNITLADGNQAVMLEIAQTISQGIRSNMLISKRTFGEYGDAQDVLTATNHYLTATQVNRTQKKPSTSSLARLKRARVLIAEDYGHHDAHSLKRLMMDKLDITTGLLYGVGNPSDNIINWYGQRFSRFGIFAVPRDLEIRVCTTISTVSDLHQGIMWVAGGKKYIDSPNDYHPVSVYEALART